MRRGAEFPIDLGLDADDLVSCVHCGLCLPHCPTYRITQEEISSPRGRLMLMAEVAGSGTADSVFVDAIDACVGCRGCEAACPSGVPYGRMLERTRAALVESAGYQPWWRRLGYRILEHPRLLRTGSRLLALVQRARLVPSRFALPPIPLRRTPLESSPRGTVWFFTGCVMDAWMGDTLAAAMRVVESTGVEVRVTGDAAPCCGALHVHAGLESEARDLARQVMSALEGDGPVLVPSAGCGAQLKEYGELLGTAAAQEFSSRVLDIHEWLADRDVPLQVGTPPAEPPPRGRPVVAVQDPCHLRHVQHAHLAVRRVLEPFFELVDLDDAGLCCGAGGAYSAAHPSEAAAIRELKLAAIDRAGGDLVASANPGCMIHLRAGGAPALHPLELVDRAQRGLL